jgi:hypothetical protein
MLLILLSSALSSASSPNNPLLSLPLVAEMSRGVGCRCPTGALGRLCEDLIVCCRGSVLLSARATAQQKDEIEAIAVRSCGMFEMIGRLSLMTRGITRILHLFRSITRVKLDDADIERRACRLKQRAMTDDCFSMSRFAKFQQLHPF